jgi:hypothetical protein
MDCGNLFAKGRDPEDGAVQIPGGPREPHHPTGASGWENSFSLFDD